MDNPQHVSVLLDECISYLNINKDGIYLDGTLGMGGHSYEIAKRLGSNGKLICIDKDSFAIENASVRLNEFKDKIIFVHDDFQNTSIILENLGYSGVDGMLFDLGVSSPQLDTPERGFSYMVDSPLDMRMDNESSLSAYEVVNCYDEKELVRILFEYGEERYARKIASNIVEYRNSKLINSTFELVDIIKKSLPAQALREKQHPAKRSFQAIRIEVNHELDSVEHLLETAPDKLNPGGRLSVISFHSLEDRIVKNKIKERENGCTCPKDYPVCVCGFKQTLKTVTKKPVVPSQLENSMNPRSRSAKLRVAERV